MAKPNPLMCVISILTVYDLKASLLPQIPFTDTCEKKKYGRTKHTSRKIDHLISGNMWEYER